MNDIHAKYERLNICLQIPRILSMHPIGHGHDRFCYEDNQFEST